MREGQTPGGWVCDVGRPDAGGRATEAEGNSGSGELSGDSFRTTDVTDGGEVGRPCRQNSTTVARPAHGRYFRDGRFSPASGCGVRKVCTRTRRGKSPWKASSKVFLFLKTGTGSFQL